MHNSGPVLVTGGSGFTGRHLIPHLESEGVDALEISMAFENSGIDLRDRQSLSSFLKYAQPKAIIHLAGISSPVHPRPNEFHEVNTVGTVNLFESAIAHSPALENFVFASTAAVYASISGPIDEDSVVLPSNPYAQSKHEAELALLSSSADVSVIVVRPFNYTGVGQSMDFVIPKLVEAYKHQIPEMSIGNLSISRDFSDVRDVVRYYERILTSGVDRTVYNICSGTSISLEKVVEILETLSSHKVRLVRDKSLVRDSENPRVLGSNRKLREEFGASPSFSFEETLEWMLRPE